MKATLVHVAGLVLVASAASQGSLIVNGDFEAPGEITSGWTYGQTTGSYPSRSEFQSPFQDWFPPGLSSIQMNDAANNGSMRLEQRFTPQSGPTYFSFDFYNGQIFGLGWSIGFTDSENFPDQDGFYFFIRDNQIRTGPGEGASMSLVPLAWHNVSGSIDPGTRTRSITGWVTPYGSPPASFTRALYDGFDSVAGFYVSDEGGGGVSSPLRLDNVLIVPESSVTGLMCMGALVAFLLSRGRRHAHPEPKLA